MTRYIYPAETCTIHLPGKSSVTEKRNVWWRRRPLFRDLATDGSRPQCWAPKHALSLQGGKSPLHSGTGTDAELVLTHIQTERQKRPTSLEQRDLHCTTVLLLGLRCISMWCYSKWLLQLFPSTAGKGEACTVVATRETPPHHPQSPASLTHQPDLFEINHFQAGSLILLLYTVNGKD